MSDPACDWKTCLEAASGDLRTTLGLRGQEYEKVVEDAEDSSLKWLIALQREQREQSAGLKEARSDLRTPDDELVFASKPLLRHCGHLLQDLLGGSAGALNFLLPKEATVHDAVNGKRCFDPLWLRLKQTERSAKNHQLLLAVTSTGKPFWALLNSFPVDISSKNVYTLYTMHALEAPVPPTLRLEGRAIRATASDASMKVDPKHEVVQGMLTRIRSSLLEYIKTNGSKTLVSDLLNVAEERCTSFATLMEAGFHGGCFVPRTGLTAVETFDKFNGWGALMGKVEQQLKTAWEISDEAYAATKDGGSKAIACSVAEPQALDCPLVYISDGFEELTQFKRAWALGRNCRFLQPRDAQTNVLVNGPELGRMKKFCTQQSEGRILNFLLNEQADGTHFWNLLSMQHMDLDGRKVVFGVQCNITLHREILDQVLTLSLAAQSRALEPLREILHRQEETFSPTNQSLLALSDQILQEWIMEFGKSQSSCYEGGSYVPKVGMGAVADFQGLWPELVDIASDHISSMFQLRKGVLASMRDNSGAWGEECVVCAVSDPSAVDCPLVFVSNSFEQMTQYKAEFALGRNCRFLQPNVSKLNDLLNGHELRRMREFCRRKGVTGQSIVNILLNERKNGERFWNLLHMIHVEVKGKPFILGVQTVLDLPMPSVLQEEIADYALEIGGSLDAAILNSLGPELADFLQDLREGVSSELAGGTANIAAMANQACDKFLMYLKASCDDFEGDHWCPRVVTSRTAIKLDIRWSLILKTLEAQLLVTWEVSRNSDFECLACMVTDPSFEDCPLVYVSRQFEELTGFWRKWAIGRSCRFLRPKQVETDKYFNDEEHGLIEDFRREAVEPGSQMLSLLVNEHKDGTLFWSLVVMYHCIMNDHHLTVTVQTRLDFEPALLGELFVQGPERAWEIRRLRQLFRSRQDEVRTKSILSFAREVVDAWASNFSKILALPRLPVQHAGTSPQVPLAGLLLVPRKDDMMQLILKALECGIRHFYLALDCLTFASDSKESLSDARLMALNLAHIFHELRLRNFHRIKQSVAFTLITPVTCVGALREFSKVLSREGYMLWGWLVSVRGASESALQAACQEMIAARRAGDVQALGFKGGSESTFRVWQQAGGADVPLSIWAFELYPGKVMEMLAEAKFHGFLNKLRKIGVCVLAYNVFGSQDALLDSSTLRAAAEHFGLEPEVLILKWAYAQGYVAMLPCLAYAHFDSKACDQQPNLHHAYARGFAAPADAEKCSKELLRAIELGFDKYIAFKERSKVASKGWAKLRALQAVTSKTLKASTVPDESPLLTPAAHKGIPLVASMPDTAAACSNQAKLSGLISQVASFTNQRFDVSKLGTGGRNLVKEVPTPPPVLPSSTANQRFRASKFRSASARREDDSRKAKESEADDIEAGPFLRQRSFSQDDIHQLTQSRKFTLVPVGSGQGEHDIEVMQEADRSVESSGQTFLPPSSASIDECSMSQPVKRPQLPPLLKDDVPCTVLSPEQQAIVTKLVGKGWSLPDICDLLEVSPHAVGDFFSNG
eukprot:TRINITY_DN106618_c0_g1_i1.p1 TRINITY_DN106618_c0_g1~~TRINITY_DN106618_c0_g1_i1.p1  ORF type:complete len:1545 (+),score=269.16 TRINITY_DN106618_c0_g1_i1:47-4636(+)